MAVEDHPKFKEWKEALERLIEVREAYEKGNASIEDVKAAKRAYFKIADEV